MFLFLSLIEIIQPTFRSVKLINNTPLTANIAGSRPETHKLWHFNADNNRGLLAVHMLLMFLQLFSLKQHKTVCFYLKKRNMKHPFRHITDTTNIQHSEIHLQCIFDD